MNGKNIMLIKLISSTLSLLMLGVALVATLGSQSASAQTTPIVFSPSTPECLVGQPWTVVELDREVSTLSDLTDPTDNNRTRRVNSLNGINSSNVNLGTRVDTGITAIGSGTVTIGDFVSWDSYLERPNTPASEQMNEQWLIEVTDGAGSVFTTDFTPDLPDGVVNAEVTGSFNASFTISGGVQSVVIRHYHDFTANTPVEFNSVVPVGFCFDFQIDEPTLACEALTAELIDDRTYRFTTLPVVTGLIQLSDLRYKYDFGDGNTLDSTEAVVEHMYDTVGMYTARADIFADQFEEFAACDVTFTIPSGGEPEVLGSSTSAEPEVLAETGISPVLQVIIGLGLVAGGAFTLFKSRLATQETTVSLTINKQRNTNKV